MQMENRREFIFRFGVIAPLLVAGCGVRGTAQTSVLKLLKANAVSEQLEWNGAKDVPDTVSWRSVLPQSPGAERMIISGTVFESDRKTVAPEVLIYFYHTDAEGYYGRNGEPRHGRFRGWLLTGKDGRYEIETIRPAAYPSRRAAAHIHMTVTTLKEKEHWIDEIQFEGDPLISESYRRKTEGRGRFNPIVKLLKGTDGIWRGTVDIAL